MQSNWHVIEMEYVFLNILLIVVQLYYGNVPKDIYGLHHLAMLNIQTRGVHIALNINVKDCVERLCQHILDRHLRYVDLIFLKL